MRIVLLVLVGLGAGVALGSVFREAPDPPRREQRVVMREVVEVRPRPLEPEVAEPEPRVVIEAEEECEPCFGWIEFDGRVSGETVEPWVPFRYLYGERSTICGEETEEGIYRFEVREGVHEVCCLHGPRGDVRCFRVEVRAGCVTRVSASEPATPDQFPIPEGLGRLDVAVFDLENESASETYVELGWYSPTGNYLKDTEPTASDGTIRFDVVPGDYAVWLGCRKRSVRVVEGESRNLCFRYGPEGEVHIEGPVVPWIRPIDGQPEEHAHAYTEQDEKTGFLYVRPGSYEAFTWFRHEAEARRLGTLSVSPGSITRFRPRDLPAASVEVAVRRPPGSRIRDAEVEVTPLHESGEPGLFRDGLGFGWDRSTSETKVHCVSAGRWRVRVTADGCDPVEREVEVGIESMRIEIPLQRSTIR